MTSRSPLDPGIWKRVLVFTPHPDDESLATGGLLQRAVAAGGAVRLVVVTDGEDNPWPQRVVERCWRVDLVGRDRWGRLRRRETLAALARLGVSAASVTFLHLPDQGLTSLLRSHGDAMISALAAELTAWRPTLVVAPAAADRHPDHSALGVLLGLAIDRLLPAGRTFATLAYVVHGMPYDAVLHLRLSAAERARKVAAIGCHRSQLLLSRRRFLSHAQPAERFIDPGCSSTLHRVRAARFVSRGLALELALPASFAAVLPATLDVLTAEEPGRLRWQSRRVAPWQREIVLALPRRAARVLVKCEAPHVFFDQAGWRAFDLGREPQTASSLPAISDAAAAGASR